jgi:hypothetical protein
MKINRLLATIAKYHESIVRNGAMSNMPAIDLLGEAETQRDTRFEGEKF